MHIALSTASLTGGHTNRGVGGYTKNLLESLKKYHKEHTYTLFDKSSGIPKDCDLVHYPNFDPFFLTLPMFSAHKTVITVHDLIPLVFPSHFPKGVRGTIKWEIQKKALLRVDRIITDSLCSKNDISRIIGFDKKRIDVIPLAPALQKLETGKKWVDVMKKYDIQEPYYLYVGDVNWNKNVPGLLQAFSLFKERNKTQSFKLVLVGKAFLDSSLKETQEINHICKQLDIESYIVRAGFVTDEDLVNVYEHAVALVQPSYYEGFGFPVLEAMTFHTPVITSNLSSLAEIAGPSMQIDPNNYQSITEAMNKVSLMTAADKKKLLDIQNNWVKNYTWQKVAQDTIYTYEKVLGKI